MKFLFSLAIFSCFLLISTQLIAQENTSSEIIAANSIQQETVFEEPLPIIYFEDIYKARKKINQVKSKVENNYENELLKDKIYHKQLIALDNMLSNLIIIEDRRLHLLNRRKNK